MPYDMNSHLWPNPEEVFFRDRELRVLCQTRSKNGVCNSPTVIRTHASSGSIFRNCFNGMTLVSLKCRRETHDHR